MLPLSTLQEICDFFSVGRVKKYEYLGLWGNHNYFVTTNQKTFVLKVLEENKNRLDQVHSEIDYIERAITAGINSPRYHCSPDGSYLYSNDTLHAQIRPKIPGSVLTKANATTEHLYQIGSLLGTLHSAPLDTSLTARECWLTLEPVQKLRNDIRNNPTLATCKLVNNPILDIDWSQYPQRLLHGDCWCSNVIISPDQSVTLLDWEETSVGPAILDIGRTMFGLAEEGLLNNIGYTALIEGYESKRQLSTAESDALPLAMKYTGLVITMWRFLRFHNSPKPYTIHQSSWHRLNLENWQIPTINGNISSTKLHGD